MNWWTDGENRLILKVVGLHLYARRLKYLKLSSLELRRFTPTYNLVLPHTFFCFDFITSSADFHWLRLADTSTNCSNTTAERCEHASVWRFTLNAWSKYGTVCLAMLSSFRLILSKRKQLNCIASTVSRCNCVLLLYYVVCNLMLFYLELVLNMPMCERQTNDWCTVGRHLAST